MPLSLYTEKNFVGRDNELDALKRVAHDALSGNATSIFLSGKWGTGKTELLMHLYNHLFRTQKETIPFFYRIKTEVSSLAGFAEDYLTAFLLQSVAFVKKEPSLLYTGIYSLKDLNKMALETGMQWAVDIIESFQQIREGGDSLRSYELAVSAPFRCFLKSEKPFIILIDDFHRLKNLVSADEAKRPWTLFENSLQSRYTPHVISGFQMNIQEMLFEESGIGEHLEVLDLDGLDKESSRQLFSALSIRFGISVEPSVINFIDIFRGNPFHIKSFAQAARQKGRTFSRKDLLSVYAKEIMNGKTRSYWTSLLKTHVPEFPMRRPALKVIYRFCENSEVEIDNLAGELSLDREELDGILNLLHASGVIETGFSMLECADDRVMVDTIRALYMKEVMKDSPESIQEAVMGRTVHIVEESGPLFVLSIPDDPKAELVAAKSLEQIAGHYNISAEITGQLQLALVELFAGVLTSDKSGNGSYTMKFRLTDNTFSMEVTVPELEMSLSEAERKRLSAYVDDIKIEETRDGFIVTLQKEISRDALSA
jgi:uncharacterized protein YbcI